MEGLPSVLIAVVPLLLVIVWQYARKTYEYPRRMPYPPGPKALPIVGNVYNVPEGAQWRGYAELSKQFGDVIFMQILGQPMLILGSSEAAIDLLERRSHIYSSRMPATMLSFFGWYWSLVIMPYGESWRAHRRVFHQYFNKFAAQNYLEIQAEQSVKFLKELLVRPREFMELTRFSFGSLIFKVVYGIEVIDSSDPYLQMAEETVQGVADALLPGSFLVDLLPFLKHVPAWFPGAGFKRKAGKYRTLAAKLKEEPYEAVRNAQNNGINSDSVVDKMLDKLHRFPSINVDEDILKNVAAIGFIAGAETSMSIAQSFFLAMAMHPDIQKKAQDELDEVVGEHRLPCYADRASLPYIEAIVMECFRWQPVVPLGVPHKSTADDEYRGYFIPKGTVVIANQWQILHDPEVYPDPERFLPDRFIKDGQINPEVKNPRDVAFGFGRRICPARYFADNSLFLNIASVLHAFDLSSPVDEHGQVIPLEVKMTIGLLSFPEPFKCIIKPRSASREALIDRPKA